jgi:hypothetical protein
MNVEARRIGMKDCLYSMLMDLASTAKALPPWQTHMRSEWFEAAVWLLGQVPDSAQRLSWTHTLAMAINGVGIPLNLIVGELWRRVEVRRCA